MEKGYRSTIYCSDNVEQDADGVMRARYCGQRWCKVCNRIRAAKLITRYGPVIDGWDNPAFVTLTVQRLAREERGPGSRAREVDAVSKRLDAILDLFGRAVGRVRRTVGIGFQAVRKLECTTDVVKGYHAHYHLIVDSIEGGRALVEAWCRFAHKCGLVADPGGQDVRPATEGTAKELFKYFTKLPTSPDANTLVMMDVVMEAMKRRRIVQPCGVEVEGDAEAEEVNPEDATLNAWDRVGDSVVWTWDDDLADWVDLDTGQILVCYELSESEPIGFVLESMAAPP